MRHFAIAEACGNGRTATPPPGCGGGRPGFAGRVGGELHNAVDDPHAPFPKTKTLSQYLKYGSLGASLRLLMCPKPHEGRE